MFASFFSLSPGPLSYNHPFVLTLLGVGAGLFVLSFTVSLWRTRFAQKTSQKLSKRWPMVLVGHGVVSIVLGVCRAEGIVFFSMPFLVFLWALLLIVTISLQVLLYRRRAYTVLPTVHVEDPREKYLPHKRHK